MISSSITITMAIRRGDRALEIIAQCLHAALRKVDVASRYGGEEFSILLPQTNLEEAGASRIVFAEKS